jgi:hypothetical protein
MNLKFNKELRNKGVISCLLAFLITFPIPAQTILTADGLAAFQTNAATGGGGGSDDLIGISLRYKGDDLTGADGTGINTWPDSSGGSHNVTQANGGKQPLVKVGVVNGHNAAQFDGVQSVLSATLSPTLIGTATATAIFVVLKQDSTQARNMALCWEGADFVRSYATYDDVLYFDYQNQTTARVNGAQPAGWDNAWHVLELHRNGANMSILVDGSSIASISTASGSLSQTGTGTFNIGNSAANIQFKGQIAEIRIYNQDKDSTTSTTIRGALKTTYGTP